MDNENVDIFAYADDIAIQGTSQRKLKRIIKICQKLAQKNDMAINLIKDEKIIEEIDVETLKAEGNKCNICWKIKHKKCERSNCPI